MKRNVTLALVCLLTLPLTAHAGELYDIALTDSISVGDQTLVLNGMGLRKKAFIKVYVGGPEPPSEEFNEGLLGG